MAEQTSRLAIIIDSTGAKNNADNLTSSLVKMTQAGETAANSAGKVTKATEDEKNALAKLKAAIDPVGAAIDTVGRRYSELKKFFDKGLIDKEEYEFLVRKLNETTEELSGVAQAQREAEKAGKLAAAQQEAQAQAFQRMLDKIDPLAAALRNLEQQHDELNAAFASGKINGSQFENYSRKIQETRRELTGEAQAEREAAKAHDEQVVALQRLIAQLDPVGTAFNRLVEQQKQLNEAKAKGMLSPEMYEELSGKLRAMRSELEVTQSQLSKTGMSAKQTAFAMRMLPAQMTDIVVGLSTGQSPFMVLMQQGGQLKDMFGGIGPAIKGVGSYVLGLINPFNSAQAAAASQTASANSATAAQKSETNAKNSETAAKASETNAKSSQTAAKTSETNAKVSETAAKNSQAAAAESESAAAGSATSAAGSATAAANSQKAAKASETNAKSSQTAAKTSETNAKASETAAKNSQDAAAQSESAAASSASAAAASATASANSQKAAKTSETNTKASETAATNSAKASAASQMAAKASEDAAREYASQAAEPYKYVLQPLPDVWIPFNDSMDMITGFGPGYKKITVRDDVVTIPSDKIVSFSRASSATYINKSGALTIAEINEPRFEKEGLLIEGQRTNYLKNSNTPELWYYHSLLAKEYGVDNYGFNYATVTVTDSLVGTTSSYQIHSVTGENRFSLSIGETCTFSARFRGVNSRCRVHISLVIGENVKTSVDVCLEPDTGEVKAYGNKALVTFRTEKQGDWCYFETTYTAAENIDEVVCGFFITNPEDGGFSSDSSLTMTTPQIEKGSCALSFIITGETPATRASDMVFIPTDCNEPSSIPLSLLVEVNRNWDIAPNSAPRIVHVANLPEDQLLVAFRVPSSDTVEPLPYSQLGVSQSFTPVSTKTSGKMVTGFVCNKSSELRCVTNAVFGAPVKTTWKAGLSKNLRIGGISTDGGKHLFGHVRNLRIWHKELTDAQMGESIK
ncbi:TPA: phage tail length tape measure family protein [Escherichia coli]|uniref:phage tail length tape measure family protein n=1 Tax=Escherichia coli TaxID=562 RepID=UPI000D0B6744|nr:phage tail length tape measure family protein [Escherichia coli]MCB8803894.1 phage tail length tape measure family protein [Escherichia coli]HBB8331130.1 phage tail length tape measure family protein [Escherichia coli]HCO6054406.1 phage tail length tape measure family protein [Escherichia coli]HCO6457909.1 phage tail length tape measure family protein [Escherichia coli]HCO6747997.1 phage tail length tape measure family protein [Escherichia coli]